MNKSSCLALLIFLVVNGPSFFISATSQIIYLRSLSQRRLDLFGGSDQQQDSEISDDRKNGEKKKKKRVSRSSLYAPFLMNEAAKEEASVTEREDTEQESEDETQSETISQQVLTGGAIKQTKPAPLLYESSVAPMAERLITDIGESDESGSVQEASAQNATDLAKLWWVNVWTQQLSVDQNSNEDTKFDDIPMEDEADVTEDDDGEQSTDFLEFGKAVEETSEDDSLEADNNVTSNITESFESEGEPVSMPEAESEAESALPPLDDELPEGFVSSGLWVPIDNLLSFGLAKGHPSIRLSRKLRSTRKFAARVTGLHGFLSGKPSVYKSFNASTIDVSNEEVIGFQKRIAAIDKAREGVERAAALKSRKPGRISFFKRRGRSKLAVVTDDEELDKKIVSPDSSPLADEESTPEEEMEENLRRERVKEIDKLIAEGQERLQELICEKDVIQRRPNPLFNYTTENIGKDSDRSTEESGMPVGMQASREFKFPPDDLVEEYLDMIFSSRRLVKMNHTSLWEDSEDEDDDEDRIGDDLLTPSANAHKLYEKSRRKKGKGARATNGGGGSWLLRQSIGKGPSLGYKIGEAAETAAYKAVCGAVMSFLARALSSLHGINVMQHSDIRLVLEQAPDLPPVVEGVIPGSSKDYAQETIKTVMRKKARKGKKRSKLRLSEDYFVQRDAVTEMLLSHVQISAPLLKLFPLAWQRALLGNIITLSTAVMSDFFDGLQFCILGYKLSFAFRPITEEDMINHLGLAGGGFNHRRARPEEFEAAVRATAEDLGEGLQFLDRWHERALGSGVLRIQIANLIARIVLTLTDEVLSGARMDLWSAAGGPRMLAGLEYRTQPS